MKTSKWTVIVAVAVGLFWAHGAWGAGGALDPTNAPGPSMYSLEELYQKLLETQQNVLETQQNVLANEQRLLAIEDIVRVGYYGVAPPLGMALIPAGDFVMGDTFAEGSSDELPLHTNTLSAFYMDQTEVTKAQWDAVYTWALANGYTFDNGGSGKATNHPVQLVSWYDCVKWANARSVKEGLTACYTVAGNVYRTGQSAPDCNWTANGYRLPTEAEWEKAARGGAAGTRFPWTGVDTIQHARANYLADPGFPAYDTSPTSGYHPDYQSGGFPYTSPVGVFAPNGYGLYDMAGNVYEWCWDWYDGSFYASSPDEDPRGPASGTVRLWRGGMWYQFASGCRVANRFNQSPVFESDTLGFRLVRAAP